MCLQLCLNWSDSPPDKICKLSESLGTMEDMSRSRLPVLSPLSRSILPSSPAEGKRESSGSPIQYRSFSLSSMQGWLTPSFPKAGGWQVWGQP